MGLVNVDTVSWVLGLEIPNAPRTGQFSAITIMKDGRLVGASGWGLSVLDATGWRNILEILGENSQVIHSSYDYNTFVADTIEYDFGGFVADIERPEHLLRQMSSALLHRGPDNQGKYLDGKVGLGHNRLSVIDLSPSGHQPMILVEDGLVLVFNGEIFNYKEFSVY